MWSVWRQNKMVDDNSNLHYQWLVVLYSQILETNSTTLKQALTMTYMAIQWKHMYNESFRQIITKVIK